MFKPNGRIPPSFSQTKGGNQREIARAKTAKKQADANKGVRDDGLTVAQRKERDAAALREKQAKAAKEKEEAAKAAGK
jgi:hypothetical protein